MGGPGDERRRRKSRAAAERGPGEKPVLPDLQLTTRDGRPCRLSDYRKKGSLVVLFSGGAECGPCRHAVMSDLCGAPEAYAEMGATAVLVLRCSPMEAELVRRREGLAVPLLLDVSGEACRIAGAQLPDGKASTALVVTDSSGRICLESRADQDGLLPTREMVFTCLRSIAQARGAGKER